MIVLLLTCLARKLRIFFACLRQMWVFHTTPTWYSVRSELVPLRFRFGFVKQHFSFSLFCSFLLNAAVYVQLWWWGRLTILQVLIILPSDLVMGNIQRMFKCLVIVYLLPVSPFSRQCLKCWNLKFSSHVSMGVLRIPSLKTSPMKIFCSEFLSAFLRSQQNLIL